MSFRVCRLGTLFLPLENPRHLDGIVTLVDAAHLIMHLDEEKPEGVENEAVEQVGWNSWNMGWNRSVETVETRYRQNLKFEVVALWVGKN